MGIFDFFKKSDRKSFAETSRSKENEYTMQLCSVCGKSFRLTYKYCPYCGTLSSFYQNDHLKKESLSFKLDTNLPAPNIDNETLIYLQKLGLLDKAQQLFKVRIAVPGQTKPVVLQLFGANRSNDALNCLYEINYLNKNLSYRFTDWPNADPVIGPWYHHVSACVCELPDCIYHVENYDARNIQVLYGCPNILALEHQVPEKTIEVIDYD